MSRILVFLSVMVVAGVVAFGSVTAQNQPEQDSKPKKESEKKSDSDKEDSEKKSDSDKKDSEKADSTKAEAKKKPEAKKQTMSAPMTPSSLIKRAAFTSAVVEREPTDDLDSLTTDTDQIFFFTEIVSMQGQQVTHRWIYDGEVMAEVPFEIGGPRWRVYSSKKLVPGWAGTWTVDVVDSAGETLLEDSFVYVASAQ